MNAVHFVSAVLIISVVNLCTIHGYNTCRNIYTDSGVLSVHQEVYPQKSFSNCWEFSVEKDEAVNLRFKKFRIRYESIYQTTKGYWYSTPSWYYRTTTETQFPETYVRIGLYDTREKDIYYRPNKNARDQLIVLRQDFNISLEVAYNYGYSNKIIVEFEMEFNKDTGIESIEGIDEVRNKAITWMKNKLQPPMEWKEDIQRSVIALQLADGVNFTRVDFMEELLIKQLDLKSSVALLWNHSNPVSINKLASIINALLITCHNPRQFFGYNLVELLKEEVEQSWPTSPAAYLALCNANETLSPYVHSLLMNILSSDSEYPFLHDIQALTVMALSCMRHKNKLVLNVTDGNSSYMDAVERLQKEQLSDGSFGNIYSTAVITQALMSSETMNKTDKRIRNAVGFLIKQLNSSSTIDFLSTYYILPILNQKTLLDIGYTDCSKYPKRDRDDVSEIQNKLGKKIMIQYSLFIGDKTDVIHTIALRVTEDTTVYEVMKLAAAVDPKYRFDWKMKSGKMYIYTIGGTTNDPEDGHFWLMYYKEKNSTDAMHTIESPDQVYMRDESHLILWYKTVQLF